MFFIKFTAVGNADYLHMTDSVEKIFILNDSR